jgi:hypothetical protein
MGDLVLMGPIVAPITSWRLWKGDREGASHWLKVLARATPQASALSLSVLAKGDGVARRYTKRMGKLQRGGGVYDAGNPKRLPALVISAAFGGGSFNRPDVECVPRYLLGNLFS